MPTRQKHLSVFSALSILALVSSCTIYSSTGRKDFESKSPTYARSTSLIGCKSDPVVDARIISAEHQIGSVLFEQSNLRLVEINPIAKLGSAVWILVETTRDNKSDQCVHEFSNHAELDSSLEDLLQAYLSNQESP